MTSKTIVLIHGLSVSKHSWDSWVAHYTAQGYRVIAPVYHPGLDKPFEILRQSVDDPILQSITLPQVITHLVDTISALDEQPIIMGHSFGGLLTQLMLQRGLGVAGIAIDSAPPKGVLPTQWSFLRSAWPAVNPLIPASTPWMMTFEQFQYAWVHPLPLDQQRAAYESIIVPESRGLYRSALTDDAKVDWNKARAPLLLIGGENDHILPASLNRANYQKYAHADAITEYKEFPGRTHYTVVAGEIWKDVADYALDWAVAAQALGAKRAVGGATMPV